MPLFIPSPPIRGFDLGPVTIRFYALCLILGIIAAWWLGVGRWKKRGGNSEHFETILFFAIPFGIVGARIYHILTHFGDYFAPGIDPLSVFYIWEGGIAIFGAISGGALGALVGCKITKARFSAFADALAPGIALGQAIGRFGNWFNQELYGQPTDLPWGLEIAPQYRVSGFTEFETFHPAFAYEAAWNLLVVGLLLLLDRKFKFGRGKTLAVYIALYGLGRIFIEGIRLDFSYDTFGVLRFNQVVAVLICLFGLGLFIFLTRTKPGREPSVMRYSRVADPSDEAVADMTLEAEPGAEPNPNVTEPDLPPTEPTTKVHIMATTSDSDIDQPQESLPQRAIID
ncbi:MAG: prolipoprotein diacylglyceryl transferase [Propionibacteriaceae bacterium]|nr:prolipoprotein diacylglyceryl transferase [Propionibacteriaceae bacterium]